MSKGAFIWAIGFFASLLATAPATADEDETVVEAGVTVGTTAGVEAELTVGATAGAEGDACDEVAVERQKKPTYLGDASSGWFHVGGGIGALVAEPGRFRKPTGRFILGGGGYTFGLYAGGGMEISGTQLVPFELLGHASLGVHIPIPVVHPMFGLKAGAGIAVLPRGVDPWFEIDMGLDDLGIHRKPIPSFMIGCQLGVMIREFDGNVGFRVMLEPAVHYYPQIGARAKEVFVTAALVL